MQQYNKYLSNHLGKIHRGDEKDFLLMEKYFSKNYLKHLPKNKQSLIVDLGCGMGHFLYFLKKNGYKNYFGVDISSECIVFCNKKKLTSKERLFCADVFGFFQKGKRKFDMVIMNDLIEHIPKGEIVPLLGLIKKSLNDNGKLIIKTINCANPLTGASSRYLDFTHTTGFTEESLSQALNMVGFEKVTICPQNIWIFGPIVNCLGKTGQGLLSLFFRLLFLLYGRKTTKIFTKDIIAVGQRSQ
jgi:2-polyprenyl-3-methyl-5-hydroxy-6-metoxy-1,4-benzoquinol methylase